MQETLARVGVNIKRLRLEKGLSQDHLAKFLEVDKAYISRVENGKKNLTLNSLAKIAKALSVEVGRFFT